ncbi:MAG: hypothetical protein RL685_3383 [Pseudomonadota bacterium]
MIWILRARPRRGFATGRVALALAAATALASAAPGAAEPAAPKPADPEVGVRLTVRIAGLRNERGSVAVALFATARGFPEQQRAIAGQLARIESGRAAVTFSGVRPGVYAVAVLHDENDNAKMDFNFLGMPLEGYGFSNDASAVLGPPSFAAAAFRLSPRPSYVAVKVRYLL